MIIQKYCKEDNKGSLHEDKKGSLKGFNHEMSLSYIKDSEVSEDESILKNESII